jgi:hypothetical protein
MSASARGVAVGEGAGVGLAVAGADGEPGLGTPEPGGWLDEVIDGDGVAPAAALVGDGLGLTVGAKTLNALAPTTATSDPPRIAGPMNRRRCLDRLGRYPYFRTATRAG